MTPKQRINALRRLNTLRLNRERAARNKRVVARWNNTVPYDPVFFDSRICTGFLETSTVGLETAPAHRLAR